MKLTYQPFLDGLRALAIILVVFNHLNLPGFSGGFVGVDVFFVISGYLITGIIVEDYLSNYYSAADGVNRYLNIRAFYFKRMRRILPVALIVLLVSLVYIYFNYSKTEFVQETNNAGWSAFFLSNFQLIINSTNYFASNLESKSAFQHFWSLAIEEQFYLVYPIVFTLAIRLHGLRSGKVRLYWYRRLAILLCIIWVLSFAFNMITTDSSPITAYFSTLTRIWEIVTGCILALLRHTKIPQLSARKIKQLAYFGLGAILYSCIFFSSNSAYPGAFALIPVIGTCVLIYVSTSTFAGNVLLVRLFSTSVIRYVGKISYSLYLIHWPLLIFLDHENPGLLDGLFGKILYCAILVILAVLSYAVIEKPTRRIPVPNSLYARKSSWIDFLMPYLSKVGGDLWFIASTLIVIILILITVNGYTPKQSTSTLFQPYVYPSSGQTLNSIENSLDSPTAAKSDNVNSLDFQNTLTIWKTNLSTANSKLTFDSQTKPTLTELTSAQHKLVPWGFQPIQRQCFIEPAIGGTTSFECDYKTFGQGTPTSILLVGDSHAQQMVSTVLEAFSNKNMNLTVFGRSACPIGGVIVSKSPIGDAACLELWQTKSKIKFANKVFDYVIASDWGAPGDPLNNIQAKEESLKFLKSIAKELIIFAPTPRYPTIDCIIEQNDATKCSGIRSALLDSRYEALSKSSGGRFFPISDFLCVGTICPAIINNTFVTIGDGSHISGAMAKQIGVPLAKFLGLSMS